MKKLRLWTCGVITDNPLTTILPTKQSIDNLRKLIKESIDNHTDLVLGPEVSVKLISIDGDIDKIIVPVKIENGQTLYKIQELEG